MGAIQNAVNGMLGTAAAAAAAGKHIKNQKQMQKTAQEAQNAQNQREIGQAENIMTEAALKGAGFQNKEVGAYLAANMLGMKPTPQYQPQYNEMQRVVSEQVLGSETYAKMQQNTMFRQRILDLGSTQEGRERLAQAASPMEDKK